MMNIDKQQQQQQHLLQLDNFYLTAEELQNSPSRLSGVSLEEERQLRIYGCEIIQVPLSHSTALLHLSACCSLHSRRAGDLGGHHARLAVGVDHLVALLGAGSLATSTSWQAVISCISAV